MSLLDKMERKFGRYAIQDLMKYIIILYVVGMILRYATPGVYETWFMLDASKILQGQVWRIFTFLLQSPNNNLLFFIITLYFYYMIGSVLERTWGSFRFNVYYFTGVLCTVLAAILTYLITGRVYYLDTTFVNASLFLAFAFEYPDMEVLLMFIIPIKMKWMAYLSMVVYAVDFIQGNMGTRIAILVSLLNFVLYFSSIIKRKGYSPKQMHRKMTYNKSVKQARRANTHHKCAVCGRTEADDENLEFRYCSRCNGNYEYCQDHLFTHQHIK
ncbi:rhomboid family intramembrane serine protease [Frisingicoccus sp.]|uniref:rhomboid family intramembrane serine protease n=1 Tax=Frisingicoccus sp. TaxID=1918627 RepID=UPI003AB8E323